MSESTALPKDGRLGRKTSIQAESVVAKSGFKRRTMAPYLRTQISLTDSSLGFEQTRALLGLVPIGTARWNIAVGHIEGLWEIRTTSVRGVILASLLVLLGLASLVLPYAQSLPIWIAPLALAIGMFSLAFSPKQAIEIVDVAGDRKRYDFAFSERDHLAKFVQAIAGAIAQAQNERDAGDISLFRAQARKRRLVKRSVRLMLAAITVFASVGAYQYFDIADASHRLDQWATEQMRNMKSNDGRWSLVPPPGRSLDTIDPNETPTVITPAQLPHLTRVSFPRAGTYPGFESTVGMDAFLDGDPSAQPQPVEPVAVVSGYLVGKEKQADGSHLFAVEVPFLNGQVFDGPSASSTVDCQETTSKPVWDPEHEFTESLAGGVIVWLNVYPAINTSWYPLTTGISYGTDAFMGFTTAENSGAQGPDALYEYAKIGDPIRATVDLGLDLESASMQKALNSYVDDGHAATIEAARAQIQDSLAGNSAALKKLMSDCRTSVSLTDQMAGKRYVVSPSDVAFLPGNPEPPALGTLDQANDPTIWNTYGATGGNGVTAFAQTFTAGLTGKLPQVDLYLRSESGGTGAMTVSIWPTDKSGLPAGSAIATSAPVSVAGERWHEFSFSSPATVAAGTSYAIVFSPGDGIDVIASYLPYRGGQALFERSGWHPDGSNGQPSAFLFRTYVETK